MYIQQQAHAGQLRAGLGTREFFFLPHSPPHGQWHHHHDSLYPQGVRHKLLLLPWLVGHKPQHRLALGRHVACLRAAPRPIASASSTWKKKHRSYPPTYAARRNQWQHEELHGGRRSGRMTERASRVSEQMARQREP